MAAQINETTQYTDESTGELLNNGYIYIGSDGLDAKINPASIYSDRDLTVSLANPQRIGPDGRALNKIWVSGKYSMKVEDSANVQKLNDLSLGIDEVTSNTVLTNIQGTDAITADGSPTITSLVSNQVYIFTAANTNTGAMTLTIDLITTYPIKKQHDKAMVAGDVEADQAVALIWNSTDEVFELMTNSALEPVDVATNQTIAGNKTFSGTTALTGPVNISNPLTVTDIASFSEIVKLSKGADIVSASALTLGTDGNSFDVTGTTTITSIATVGVGTHVTLQFDGILTLTHHATDLILPGAANITTAAGDTAVFYEYASGDWRCVSFSKASGLPITNPTVTHAASDGASTVLVGSGSASGSSSVTFTGLSSTYDWFRLVFLDVVAATSTADFRMRTSTDNGSSYDTSNYLSYSQKYITTGALSGAAATTSIILAYDSNNTANNAIAGHIDMFSLSSITARKKFESFATWTNPSGNVSKQEVFAVHTTAASDIDAIEFTMSTGNITSGEFYLYGMKRS